MPSCLDWTVPANSGTYLAQLLQLYGPRKTKADGSSYYRLSSYNDAVPFSSSYKHTKYSITLDLTKITTTTLEKLCRNPSSNLYKNPWAPWLESLKGKGPEEEPS